MLQRRRIELVAAEVEAGHTVAVRGGDTVRDVDLVAGTLRCTGVAEEACSRIEAFVSGIPTISNKCAKTYLISSVLGRGRGSIASIARLRGWRRVTAVRLLRARGMLAGRQQVSSPTIMRTGSLVAVGNHLAEDRTRVRRDTAVLDMPFLVERGYYTGFEICVATGSELCGKHLGLWSGRRG